MRKANLLPNIKTFSKDITPATLGYLTRDKGYIKQVDNSTIFEHLFTPDINPTSLYYKSLKQYRTPLDLNKTDKKDLGTRVDPYNYTEGKIDDTQSTQGIFHESYLPHDSTHQISSPSLTTNQVTLVASYFSWVDLLKEEWEIDLTDLLKKSYKLILDGVDVTKPSKRKGKKEFEILQQLATQDDEFGEFLVEFLNDIISREFCDSTDT